MGIILALMATLLHIALCFAIAPFMWGLIVTLRARIQGQPGPSVRQPYRHLARLLGKAALVPDTATEFFTVWPLVAFVAFAVAVMLIPGFCTGMLTASAGDYLTVIGLFALGRAAMMLGGQETGSAFGGASGARLAFSGLYADATLLVLVLTFALLRQGTASLNGMALAFGELHAGGFVAMGFALAAMVVVAFTEAGYRPAGQQELVMSWDSMALEYSGRLLALLDYADMLRRLAWMNLIICIFIPFGMARAGAVLSWPGGLLFWGLKLLCLVTGVAVLTAIRAETRLSRLPEALSVALFLGLVASLFLVVMVRAGS